MNLIDGHRVIAYEHHERRTLARGGWSCEICGAPPVSMDLDIMTLLCVRCTQRTLQAEEILQGTNTPPPIAPRSNR